MCGIAGFIDASLSNAGREELLERMLQSIAHRGPDARGKYIEGPLALGHNRLSIIDLSAEGNQPMQYGHYRIVYNGEVYNYLEIKKELESAGLRFHTHSDTEVILAAYSHWGSACVQKFMGMWAFAIWDEQKQELFCSRDRFGIKPFYYLLEGDKFYFGSEYKVFNDLPFFKRDFNLNQIARGLQLGWNCYRDETYFENLHALAAANNLVWKAGKIKTECYWTIDTNQSGSQSLSDSIHRFRELFTDSVALHMRSDVEVGGCLSGGLDSSAIAGVIGKNYSQTSFKTFTVYYEGKDEVDERPWVNKVLEQYPNLDPYYFTPSDQEIADSFAHALYHADVPVAGSSPLSQYFVMKLAASQKIKVLLDGQGSDEMLAGYMHSFYRLIGAQLAGFNLTGAWSELRSHARTQNFSPAKQVDILAKSLIGGLKSEQKLYELEYKQYFPFLPASESIPFHLDNKPGSRLNQFLYQLTTISSLPTLLQFEDRNSMAFSIESRVPFLDHRLVEFAFSLPDEYKIQQGITKRILRDGLSSMLPEAIRHRKDKKGFVTPGEVKWLRGPLRFLLEQDFSKLDFLRQKQVKSILDDFKRGDNRHANLVWRLAVLRYWVG